MGIGPNVGIIYRVRAPGIGQKTPILGPFVTDSFSKLPKGDPFWVGYWGSVPDYVLPPLGTGAQP